MNTVELKQKRKQDIKDIEYDIMALEKKALAGSLTLNYQDMVAIKEELETKAKRLRKLKRSENEK